MKTIAIIIAGGVGNRMGANIPKQFIEIYEKPIIAYTLERFQANSKIDKILIVCIHEWSQYVEQIVIKYNIRKTMAVIGGGICGHDSIRNGVFFLKDKLKEDDYVLIHDSVRPIVPQKAIDEVLCVAHNHGNASSSIICHPPIVYTEDNKSGFRDIPRDQVMLTASPQVYKYNKLLELYERAEFENRHNFTFTSSMYIYYGERIYFAKGTTCNIKITTKSDLGLFKALLSIPEEEMFD